MNSSFNVSICAKSLKGCSTEYLFTKYSTWNILNHRRIWYITECAKPFELLLPFCWFVKPVIYIYAKIFNIKPCSFSICFTSFRSNVMYNMAWATTKNVAWFFATTFVMTELCLPRFTDFLEFCFIVEGTCKFICWWFRSSSFWRRNSFLFFTLSISNIGRIIRIQFERLLNINVITRRFNTWWN